MAHQNDSKACGVLLKAWVSGISLPKRVLLLASCLFVQGRVNPEAAEHACHGSRNEALNLAGSIEPDYDRYGSGEAAVPLAV